MHRIQKKSERAIIGVLETTSRETVCTVVVISWVNIGRIEVQVIGVRSIRSRRPVVAVWSLIVNTSASVVAVTCYVLGDDWICVLLSLIKHLVLLPLPQKKK